MNHVNRFISELVQTYLITVGPIIDSQSAPMALCPSASARCIKAAFGNEARFDWRICWPSDEGLQSSGFFVHDINLGVYKHAHFPYGTTRTHNRIKFDTGHRDKT